MKSDLINEIINHNCESDRELVKSKIFKCSDHIKRERYDIENEQQAKYYKKDIGRYELISTPNPLEMSDNDYEIVIDEMIKILKNLIGTVTAKDKILVVGLGNRHISADSLGTSICRKINVNSINKKSPTVMALCPSVMGLTGIETYEIVRGVIDRIRPTHLILIDSLCASDQSRLARSIQITNTGLCPGSGIGNNRKCLDKTLAKNVISIGVPLLIFADTFIENALTRFNITSERLNSIMQTFKKSQNIAEINNLINDIENIKNEKSDTIVTIKDIEDSVKILADIISAALNISMNVAE